MQLLRNCFLPMLAAACGSDPPGVHDAGTDGIVDPDAIVGDADIDANEGTGQRLGGMALGIREPVRVTATLGAIRRHVLVTEDGAFQLPGKLEPGLAYDVTVDSDRCRIVSGTGTIGNEDVTSVELYCSGVVELAGLTVARPHLLSPALHGERTSYALLRPLFATDADPATLTPALAYPGVATISINGSTASHQQTITLPTGPVVSIALSHSSGLSRTYTLAATSRAPEPEAYVKAREITGAMQFGSGGPCGPAVTTGNGVAVSGDTLVVGAPCHAATTTQSGAAYVYRRAGIAWAYEATLPIPASAPLASGDRFGGAVAIEGDTIVVGAAGDGSPTGALPGKVYVYTRTGTTWTFQQLLVASNPSNGDLFGRAVAISGSTIVVGAPREDTANNNASDNSGAIYVFIQGATWTQQAMLRAAPVGSELGFSVDVSGETLIAGAPIENAAYIFTRTGTTWGAPTRLAGTGDFGWAVSIDGDRLAIGAPSDDTGAADRGAVHVYQRGSSWTLDATLIALFAGAGDGFGTSVDVDRVNLVVGAPGEDGALRGVDPSPNESASGAGAAYAFRRTTGWIVKHYVKATNTDAGDAFGSSVAADGDSFAVGAYGERSIGTDGSLPEDNSQVAAGAVYVYR